MNKKGNVLVIGTIITLALILIGVVVAIKNTQPDIPSKFTKLREGCDAPVTPVAIQGVLLVEDRATFGVEPAIKNVNVISVRPAIGETLGITSEDFAWKVELVEPDTDAVLDTEKGNEIQEGGSSVNEIPFVLYFKQPDNNCDGQIDDFKLIARAKINYDLLLESPQTLVKDVVINYQGGRLQ